MPVRVFKKSQSTFLANPVTLKLTPLTVAAAQSRGIIGDFPDDEISPNRARETHIFSNSIDTKCSPMYICTQRRQILMELC